MKEVNARNCGRENDLLDFLYGEMNDAEARSFQLHVHDCAACDAELVSFRDVRQSVVTWRNESLGGLLSAARNFSPTAIGQGKPSALAALREFFTLAPLWMKGAVAFASVLFCLFAGLAVTRWRDNPPAATVSNQGSNANAEQKLRADVARLQDELLRIKNSEQPQVKPVIVENNSDRTLRHRVVMRANEVAASVPSQKLRRPLTRTEREQLAADLRLTTAKNDSDLDLLGDRINQ